MAKISIVLGIYASLGLAAQGALGAGAGVENHCPWLAPSDFDELNARVLLRLAAARRTHSLLSVVCTDDAVWVDWEGRTSELPKGGRLVDEVLELIDRTLESDEAVSTPSDPPTPSPARPRSSLAAPSPAEQPPVDVAASPRRPRPRRARNRGGFALGLENELPARQIGTALGPVFEEGIHLDYFTLGAREAFRFSLSDPQVSFMDIEALLGFGAPLRQSEPLGVAARFGIECMVAHPKGTVAVAAAPLMGIGLRAARDFERVGLWLGLDGRLRLKTLHVGEGDSVTVNDITASFSFGVTFLDSRDGAHLDLRAGVRARGGE